MHISFFVCAGVMYCNWCYLLVLVLSAGVGSTRTVQHRTLFILCMCLCDVLQLVTPLLGALEHGAPRVRCAACKCFLSLSRSIKVSLSSLRVGIVRRMTLLSSCNLHCTVLQLCLCSLALLIPFPFFLPVLLCTQNLRKGLSCLRVAMPLLKLLSDSNGAVQVPSDPSHPILVVPFRYCPILTLRSWLHTSRYVRC